MSDACEFGSLDEANEILGLMMRHWNGNYWAHGFMRGMGMRSDGWVELVDDEEHGGCPSLRAPLPDYAAGVISSSLRLRQK